jgi:hypothetical protein
MHVSVSPVCVGGGLGNRVDRDDYLGRLRYVGRGAVLRVWHAVVVVAGAVAAVAIMVAREPFGVGPDGL